MLLAVAVVFYCTPCFEPLTVTGFVPTIATTSSPSASRSGSNTRHRRHHVRSTDIINAKKNSVVVRLDAETASSSTSASTSSESESASGALTLFSPCKINLFLRIIRKREDGYHDLASLFQAIGFGDTLELRSLAEEGSVDSDLFSCNMPGVPVDSTNLVLRALELMRTKTGNLQHYFSANLIKQVPAQAGLGGGSANAATAMWGANELMGRPATLEQVCCVCARVCVCVCRRRRRPEVISGDATSLDAALSLRCFGKETFCSYMTYRHRH
jgi:hypothetical protein